MPAARTTNTDIKLAIDELTKRFDLFEQAYGIHYDQIKRRVDTLDHEVFGNSKEGMRSTVKTLKEDFDRRCAEGSAQRSANLSLRNSLVVLVIGQVITLAVAIIGIVK